MSILLTMSLDLFMGLGKRTHILYGPATHIKMNLMTCSFKEIPHMFEIHNCFIISVLYNFPQTEPNNFK